MEVPFLIGVMFSHYWQSLASTYQAVTARWRTFFKSDRLDLIRAYLTPTSLSKEKAFWQPVVACVALIGLIVFSAWSIAALLHMVFALLAIYLIITQVFQIRLDLDPSVGI